MMSWLPARVVIAVIGLYQRWISPLLGQHCRFYPSCSSYAVEAISEHGLLRGSMLAARRLARCQPFSAGGVDPVPRRHTHVTAHPNPLSGAQL